MQYSEKTYSNYWHATVTVFVLGFSLICAIFSAYHIPNGKSQVNFGQVTFKQIELDANSLSSASSLFVGEEKIRTKFPESNRSPHPLLNFLTPEINDLEKFDLVLLFGDSTNTWKLNIPVICCHLIPSFSLFAATEKILTFLETVVMLN